MVNPNTPRRVLQNLPVNTVGTPKALKLPSPAGLYRKRSISEVDEPIHAPSSTRRCGKEHEQRPVPKPLQHPLVLASEFAPKPMLPEEKEEAMEQSTQGTNNDVDSSAVDSDGEGDTLNTQQTAATELSQPTRSSTPANVETLRLRLRLALFKVRTDQTNIPLSQLRIPSPKPVPSPRPSSPALPSLLPAPILKPTAYSMRKIEQPRTRSSPPSSSTSSPGKEKAADVFQTRAMPRREPSSSQQLSSPPSSHDGEHGVELEDPPLSSSPVEGHKGYAAASSLLDLKGDRR
ncbi:MAG: hypothetical protein Q9212_004876 [Teloschistes hypoglaucus]